MVAGGDHGRFVKVFTDVAAEGLFDLHQPGERSTDPVGRVGYVGGIHFEEARADSMRVVGCENWKNIGS